MATSSEPERRVLWEPPCLPNRQGSIVGSPKVVTFTQVGWLTGDGEFFDLENFRPVIHLREGDTFSPVFVEGPNE